jgi:hypothetical protein
MSDWAIKRQTVQDVRRVDLLIHGLPVIPCNRWKKSHFKPADVSLEYRIEWGAWELTRVEAAGPVCNADGTLDADSEERHIFSWLTPLRPTKANPGGVPDWVTELGRQYMPQPLADRITEK